jgi:hypothetical protein
MKIYRQDQDNNFEQWRDWHVITVAQERGGALELYARSIHGIDPSEIKKFTGEVNEKNEPLTLYPKAPLSALPYRYFNFMEDYDFPYVIDEFRKYIEQWAEINRTEIKARKILVDFHRDSAPVNDCYLTAAERAFPDFMKEGEADIVALMK